MNRILYETSEQMKHIHKDWEKVVAVDEIYWRCTECKVTSDEPVAPEDEDKEALAERIKYKEEVEQRLEELNKKGK